MGIPCTHIVGLYCPLTWHSDVVYDIDDYFEEHCSKTDINYSTSIIFIFNEFQ